MSPRFLVVYEENTFYDDVDVTASVVARGVGGCIPDHGLPVREKVSWWMAPGDKQYGP